MRARLALLLSLLTMACGSSSSPADAGALDAGADTVAADTAALDLGGDLAASEVAPASDGSAGDAGDGSAGATVMGTLTLPAATTGKPWFVRVVASLGAAASTPVAQASGVTAGSAKLDYTIAGVPAGAYYLLGFVDVDASGGTASTPGDFAAWYGHGGDGNPPPEPNAIVPATGAVRFDFSLVQR